MKISSIFLAILIVGLNACGSSTRPGDIDPAVLTAAAPPALPTPVPATVTPTRVTPLPEPAQTATLPAVATVATAPPGAPVVTLKLSGGIIGFCDELTVDEAGQYLLRRPCHQDEFSGVLAPPDLDSLTSWAQNLAGFRLNFEDNPNQADNLVSELVFHGQGPVQADETQQRAIFDWANGLLIRVRPQPVPPPTPAPIAVGPEGLCPHIQRPAVLVIDFERPGGLTLIDPASQATCAIQLQQPPFGRIVTAAGNLYYPIFDQAAKTVTVWRLSPSGEQSPLTFTTVSMEQFGPYSFTISDDGSRIVWARAVPHFDQDPPRYRNDLWVANEDGSGQVTLLNQVEQERRYVEPVRFSPDKGTLYYAVQPDGLGGMIFSFSGRYDSLYSLPTTGGEARLLFACPPAQLLCIGDISPDGSALAYFQPDQGLVILGSDGRIINSLTPPASDYVGSPVFGPTGQLAFVSAALTQASEQDLPRPNPGLINLIAPPYTGPPQTLLSDNSVTTVWEWLDENRLIYGAMAEDGNVGTALVTLTGQRVDLSPNFALAVLR